MSSQGRQTVTTWLRAAQISDDYRSAFYHLPNIGRKSHDLLDAMTCIISQQLHSVLETAKYIRIVLDESLDTKMTIKFSTLKQK